MWQDIRLAFRQAKQRPTYALACIGVLAFGLGTCTAVFSALYSAVLKPLPYSEPDRLVVVHNRFPDLQSLGASPADYFNLSQRRELFAEAGAFYFLDLNLSGIDVPKKVNAVAASSSLFHLLGVQPLLGRTFDGVEQRYRGPHAVILSEAYWQSVFGRDPAILHRSLRLNGELYPIVGISERRHSNVDPIGGSRSDRQPQLLLADVRAARAPARLRTGIHAHCAVEPTDRFRRTRRHTRWRRRAGVTF